MFAEVIDVVIPCCPREFPLLRECVRGIRDNGIDIGRIIVVTERASSCEIRRLTKKLDVEIFFEELLPFTLEEVGHRLYRQLLNLYLFRIIPDLTKHVLILNPNTIFFSPYRFVTEGGKTLFMSTGSDDGGWFFHAQRLIPHFRENPFGFSSIHNFMVFRRDVIEKLFCEVETFHRMPFWRAYIYSVDSRYIFTSEWEIYFNYFLIRYPREFCWQTFLWEDRGWVCLDR